MSSFKKPGPVHRARWMNKAIYALKMYLFRQQLSLSSTEEKSLRKFCIFVVNTYLPSWYTAPKVSSAARYDLLLLKSLAKQKKDSMWLAAAEKFKQHLWYLSPELIGFAFFDDGLDMEIKKKMVQALQTPPNHVGVKRANIDLNDVETACISHFVNAETRNLFERFKISTAFLEKDVSNWSNDDDFRNAQSKLRNVSATNDNAERGVALISEFNDKITKDEEQKQYLLQIINQHRKSIPFPSKTVLINNE